MDTIKQYYLKLYKEGKTYTLLQLFYSFATLASLMVCGIIALINQSLGITLLFVPCGAAAILGINALAWSILKTFLDGLTAKNANKK
ncbi:hypothetical protein IKG54_01770 [Candidatus Saccharibacteria bacterium]|nr:hypothetical protein [Candidatus Saccharibacteria bacterium]